MQKFLNRKAIGLVAVLAVLSLLALPVSAQEITTNPASGPVNSITVNGFGEASGTPDVAYITLGIDTVNTDVGQAVEQANTQMDAIIAALGEAGVVPEDIQTAYFNVYSDFFDANNQPTTDRVYHVQNSVTVTVRDTSQVSGVINAALEAGANSVNGLSFGIADTSSLEQEARQAAVDDARQRAQQLADIFGVTLGDAIIITEVPAGYFPGMPYASQVGLGGAGGPQIAPGQLQVSVQVSVTFAIAS
jgi:uncharacterized protein